MNASRSAQQVAVTMSFARRLLVAFLLATLSVTVAAAQSDRQFSIPLADLKTFADSVIVSMDVEIKGNSKVHKLDADCEMHFGAAAPAYKGTPPGLVLEPMNLCINAFPGKSKQSNKDWEDFGRSLKGATVKAEGVPRIWPEHLMGGGDSNPDHALELHPMTKLQRGNGKLFDFTSFIFAPNGFDGGVSAPTAEKILTEVEVTVTEQNGMVDVDFEAGRIGNFTTLQLSILRDSIVEVSGSHRMDGEVKLGGGQKAAVRLVTVAGTKVNKAIAGEKGKTGRKALEALVLFSLSPEALLKAAQASQGQPVTVDTPIQLIVYGPPDAEE